MFIETQGRRIISFERVRSALVDSEKRLVTVYYDDEKEIVPLYEWDRALMSPKSMIPALPGTYLLNGEVKGDALHVWKTPVIAWAAAFDGRLYPVTTEGVNDDLRADTDVVILHPSGEVDQPFVHSWRTYQDWENSMLQAGKEKASGGAAAETQEA